MTTDLYSVKPELAVQVAISEKDGSVSANVRIIAVTPTGQRLSIEGSSNGPSEALALRKAFKNAYREANSIPVNSDNSISVIVGDRETLVRELALAYGIPQHGDKILIPL